ncbi:regulatory protein RecX [Sediminivirga luteola]|uniref:Regulatory protein RecX n=1 Tax=Sediminivirga luteola TaxID=1774748 RepID=A0A8J2TXA9_9MICO|nr:regulatory protein RecX [Sediminivirga luteola]GGA11818.1 regulatory protein RecX [Sediminivirga luteola]
MPSSEAPAADGPGVPGRGEDARAETLERLRHAIAGVGADGVVSAEARGHAEDVEAGDDADYAKAKKRGLNMLSARSHSVAELRRKLIAKEHTPEAAERVVVRFQELGLLDDAAYAEEYVRGKREGRALSKAVLRRELADKGVAEEHISQALAPIEDADEAELAIRLVEKKLPGVARLPREKQERRLLGMLARRGFPPGLSLRIVSELLDDAGTGAAIE